MQERLKTRTIRLADRPIESIGLVPGFWGDVYHRSMTASWRAFLGAIAATFFILNIAFAGLFALGTAPVANMPPGDFPHYIFFSVETLGTVGYGDMHPQTTYGHIVASCETFTGLIFAAVITGMIFARFSRPLARVLFSEVMTVGDHDGQPVLSVRLANARHNTISNATAKLWILRKETTREGRIFRRFHELAILRNESPTFVLSWSLFHVIDAASPLFGLGPQDVEDLDASFVVTMQGHDENFAQGIQARRTYTWRDLRWNAHFVDLFTYKDDGGILIDYRRFHEVEAEVGADVEPEIEPDVEAITAAPVRAAS